MSGASRSLSPNVEVLVRLRGGRTQDDFAAFVSKYASDHHQRGQKLKGISGRALQRWESGKPADRPRLQLIADACGV